MSEYRLGEIEARFADMIWKRAPLSSGELVKLAEKELTWKKSTTYTVLRRLCERGIFQNEGGQVTALISRDDFYAAQSEAFVKETFSGSLPAFLAAFSRKKKLSEDEIVKLEQMIAAMRK